MLRFILHTVPVLVLLLLLFSFAVDVLDAGPIGTMSVLDPTRAPLRVVLSTWVLEALGLVALFLLVEGRSSSLWLDGLLAGWVAWIFRGPLLVVTIVVAAGRAQDPWWRLSFGWWVLYSVCGLAMAFIATQQAKRDARPEAPGADPQGDDTPTSPESSD